MVFEIPSLCSRDKSPANGLQWFQRLHRPQDVLDRSGSISTTDRLGSVPILSIQMCPNPSTSVSTEESSRVTREGWPGAPRRGQRAECVAAPLGAGPRENGPRRVRRAEATTCCGGHWRAETERGRERESEREREGEETPSMWPQGLNSSVVWNCRECVFVCAQSSPKHHRWLVL